MLPSPFELVYQRHGDELYRFLSARLDEKDVADAFQKAILQALRAYPGHTLSNDLHRWFLAIGQSVLADSKRNTAPGSCLVATAKTNRPAQTHGRPTSTGPTAISVENVQISPAEDTSVVLRMAPTCNSSGSDQENAASTETPADLNWRWRMRARKEDLIDVSFAIAESPVGELLFAATTDGICCITFAPDTKRQLHQLARIHGPRVLAQTTPFEALAKQLHEYFMGRRQSFDLTLDLSAVTPFDRDVLLALAGVEYGTVTTYGALAREAGRPLAARAVGGTMNRNPVPIVLPCHRVVGSTGDLTGYAGGLPRKKKLLALEGLNL